MTARGRVEQAAIRAAQTYALANGHAGERDVIGLILAGMVIASRVTPMARRHLSAGYAEQHPQADAVLTAWADRIDAAIGEDD